MADKLSTTTHVTRIIGLIKRPDDLLREMARHPQLCCLLLTFLTSFIVEYVYRYSPLKRNLILVIIPKPNKVIPRSRSS